MSVRPLPPVLAEKALKELKEDPQRVKDDLQALKDWLAKQPHLNVRIDDQWLLAFLRGAKFSLERAKEKLDLYYTARSNAPEFFRLKHTDPLFDEILSLGSMLILPKLAAPDAPRIGFVRSGVYDPNKYDLYDIMAVSDTLLKIMILEDDNMTVAGLCVVGDLSGMSVGHFMQVTPSLLKKSVVMAQDASPLRMKGSHYLNAPAAFETVFNMLKTFLNEKNKNRLFVHKNFEALHEHVPKEVLPEEYGGNGGSFAEIIEYWRNKVKEYSAFLEEDYKHGSDESKRPGKPKTAEDLFGIGSFRQLQVD